MSMKVFLTAISLGTLSTVSYASQADHEGSSTAASNEAGASSANNESGKASAAHPGMDSATKDLPTDGGYEAMKGEHPVEGGTPAEAIHHHHKAGDHHMDHKAGDHHMDHKAGDHHMDHKAGDPHMEKAAEGTMATTAE